MMIRNVVTGGGDRGVGRSCGLLKIVGTVQGSGQFKAKGGDLYDESYCLFHEKKRRLKNLPNLASEVVLPRLGAKAASRLSRADILAENGTKINIAAS
jgi:hypothetical protein